MFLRSTTAKDCNFEVNLESRGHGIYLRTTLKAISVKATYLSSNYESGEKSDMTETVEDLLYSGLPVMATTAEHPTE